MVYNGYDTWGYCGIAWTRKLTWYIRKSMHDSDLI